MSEPSKPAVAASIALKFADADALAESLKAYSGEHGQGGLCIQVVKYYELGDRVRLTLEYGDAPLPMTAVVAWRRPGYIGVRFQPATADENRGFGTLRKLLGSETAKLHPAPLGGGTKPFAE